MSPEACSETSLQGFGGCDSSLSHDAEHSGNRSQPGKWRVDPIPHVPVTGGGMGTDGHRIRIW